MFNIVKNKLKNNKGFTIVELLTVVALLAVLLGISIPTTKGINKYLAKRSAIRDMNIVRANLEMFRTGHYPYMEKPNFVWYAGSFEPEIIKGKYTGKGTWKDGKIPDNTLTFTRAQKNGNKQHIEWNLPKDNQAYGNQFLLYSFGRNDNPSDTRISTSSFPKNENAIIENTQDLVRMPHSDTYKYCIYLTYIKKENTMSNGKKAQNDCVEVHCTREDLEIKTNDGQKAPLIIYFNSESGVSGKTP
ncbi:MAG: type II secretion system protein [Candidatus Fimenecus sp.]